MDTIYIIALYWVIAIWLTYAISHYQVKKDLIYQVKRLYKKNSFWKKTKRHLYIWICGPILFPFALIYQAILGVNIEIDKLKYKNRPRPVSKDMRKYYKKDDVLDEKLESLSLAEYNYKHGSIFTLDQVYGNGYEASLNKKEKNAIKENSWKYGVLRIDENILVSSYTNAVKDLGNAMLSGDFSAFNNFLSDKIVLILHEKETIIGKNEVLDYWKGWRERHVVTKTVTKFAVKHSNYYSHSCLLMNDMLVTFTMKSGKINKMMLSPYLISEPDGGQINLITDYSFNDDFIE